MSLKIIDNLTSTTIDLGSNLNFDAESNSYILLSSTVPGQINIEFPFQRFEDENVDDYDIFLFNNQDFRLNDIFPVHLDDLKDIDSSKGRIGWIFPLQVMFEDHTQLNIYEGTSYQYFNKYLYIAFKKLLLSNDIPSLTPKINLTDINQLNLLLFYTENCHILVLSKSRIDECNKLLQRKFEIDQCLPFFYLYGYGYINRPALFEDIVKRNRDFFLVNKNKNLYIKRFSEDLEGESFILSLFKGPLMKENNLVFIFHSLYQVIEILIQKIFNCELEFFPSKFKEENSNFYKIKEKLDTLTKENVRVQLLFTEYLQNNVDFPELKEECVKLLKASSRYVKEADPQIKAELEGIKNNILSFLDKETIDATDKEKIKEFIKEIVEEVGEKSNVSATSKLIYRTRSLIFHEFKALPQNYDLTGLNKNFLLAIIVIIIEFRLKKMPSEPKQESPPLSNYKFKELFKEMMKRATHFFKK